MFCDGRREYALKAGQGFMIFPDGVTVYTADSVTPWDYVWVGFSGAMSEQLAENRLALPAAARRQLVEREEQLLGAVQSLADRRRDGVEPSPGAHLFKVVHFCVACL